MNEKIREIISDNNILDTHLEGILRREMEDEFIIDYIWKAERRSIIKGANLYVYGKQDNGILFVLTDKKLLICKKCEGLPSDLPPTYFYASNSLPLDCIKRSYSNYHYDSNSLAFELSIDKEYTNTPLYIECELTDIKCHDFIKNLVQALIEKNTGKE